MKRRKSDLPEWYQTKNYLHFDYQRSFEDVESLVTDKKSLCKHAYWPFLKSNIVTKTYVPEKKKVKEKHRPIMYASHIDAHIYSYFSKKLSKQYENYIEGTPISDSAIAYRKIPRNEDGKGKSNIHFANEVFQYIANKGECVAVCYDVSSFFESLNHNILKKNIEGILSLDYLPEYLYRLFKSLTKYSYVEKAEAIEVLEKEDKRLKYRLCSDDTFDKLIRGTGLIEKNNKPFGIPQGSPLSALLSNVYMIEFDHALSNMAKKMDGLYRRYSDDIIFVVNQSQQNEYEELLKKELQNLGLGVNDKKKNVTHFEKKNTLECKETPLQYLGFIFDGERALLRSSSIARYYQKMKRSIYKVKSIADENDEPFKYKKGLYERFTHLGEQNFITYAYFADKEMDNSEIRGQVKGHWDKFHEELDKDL